MSFAEPKAERARVALEEFTRQELDTVLGRARETSPVERALALFHRTKESVPAYRKFLSEHGVTPSSVRTPSDFARLR